MGGGTAWKSGRSSSPSSLEPSATEPDTMAQTAQVSARSVPGLPQGKAEAPPFYPGSISAQDRESGLQVWLAQATLRYILCLRTGVLSG